MQDARRRKRKAMGKILPILVVCLLLVVAVPALARVAADHDLPWYVIAGGGGKTSSTGHTLMGTIGQPVTGRLVSSGYTLCSGFWCARAVEYRIFLPLVMKSYR